MHICRPSSTSLVSLLTSQNCIFLLSFTNCWHFLVLSYFLKLNLLLCLHFLNEIFFWFLGMDSRRHRWQGDLFYALDLTSMNSGRPCKMLWSKVLCSKLCSSERALRLRIISNWYLRITNENWIYNSPRSSLKFWDLGPVFLLMTSAILVWQLLRSNIGTSALRRTKEYWPPNASLPQPATQHLEHQMLRIQ